MPKKFTYTEIKSKVEQKGEAILLSSEYVNSSSPLLFKCKCGNIYKASYRKFTKGQCRCPKCNYKKIAKKNAFPLETIIEIIHIKGCEYISGEYKNNLSRLKIRCACGNIFERDFNHFNRGQINCQQCANKKTASAKIKHSIDDFREKLKTKNITLLDEKYISFSHNLHCKCEK